MHHNSEHYADPTAGQAEGNIRRDERRKKRVLHKSSKRNHCTGSRRLQKMPQKAQEETVQ